MFTHHLWLLASVTLIVLLTAGVEAWLHRRSLRRIPIRIHVNGTRGKSSVTRLIAAGLRAGGVTTCAKTTGTLARMILPDGSEYPIYRPSSPNVLEQLRIVDVAAAYRARALVVECMALQPILQWISESKLVRATHGVITNARPDHLEVMGPTEQDVACALAGMVPVRGKMFTAERRHLGVIRRVCADRRTEMVAVSDVEIREVTPADLEGFSYFEHAENVALALRVCDEFGVDRATALRGMWEATPDPGVMTTCRIDFFGREVYFVNGFAANDPESTERIWRLALSQFPQADKRVAIFNCRLDRPDRSQQLGKACAGWPAADHYVLIGSGTYIFARAASRAGIDVRRLVLADHQPVDEIFETVMSLVERSALVMGMGNIGGPGLQVVQYFKNRSVPEGCTS
jgi:poly-gamma-glutamate synthase PgsB/CapB